MTDDLPAPRDDASPIAGEPTNADELVPEEHQPDPPEGARRQPRERGAIEDEPGGDL